MDRTLLKIISNEKAFGFRTLFCFVFNGLRVRLPRLLAKSRNDKVRIEKRLPRRFASRNDSDESVKAVRNDGTAMPKWGNDDIGLPHLIFFFYVLYTIRLAARGKNSRKIGNTQGIKEKIWLNPL